MKQLCPYCQSLKEEYIEVWKSPDETTIIYYTFCRECHRLLFNELIEHPKEKEEVKRLIRGE